MNRSIFRPFKTLWDLFSLISHLVPQPQIIAFLNREVKTSIFFSASWGAAKLILDGDARYDCQISVWENRNVFVHTLFFDDVSYNNYDIIPPR